LLFGVHLWSEHKGGNVMDSQAIAPDTINALSAGVSLIAALIALVTVIVSIVHTRLDKAKTAENRHMVVTITLGILAVLILLVGIILLPFGLKTTGIIVSWVGVGVYIAFYLNIPPGPATRFVTVNLIMLISSVIVTTLMVLFINPLWDVVRLLGENDKAIMGILKSLSGSPS
jgi:uncharacterized membrane protein YqjE